MPHAHDLRGSSTTLAERGSWTETDGAGLSNSRLTRQSPAPSVRMVTVFCCDEERAANGTASISPKADAFTDVELKHGNLRMCLAQ